MKELSFRQVHLDFHTYEDIDHIGSKFSKEQFQRALITGHINSVTVFAKCHHGMCYYPTEVGIMHPHLNFDLLGSQIDAAHEIGVKAPIYITAGWSANDAEIHPEWLARNKDGSMQHMNYDVNAAENEKKPYASWKTLCPMGSYGKHIYQLTEEICRRYPVVDGLFYDICFIGDNKCYCNDCLKGIKQMGLYCENEKDVEKYYILKRRKFMKNCNDILKKYHKSASIFFNGGAEISNSQYHDLQSHFELEDLPTTWGGYDKMPVRAKYFAQTGKEYLGMTAKFHTMWGEFGGFKQEEALRYECASMAAYGAKCSIGDQLHPCGEMDMETYKLIGSAYKYLEKIEDYCSYAEDTANLGIVMSRDEESNYGLVNMLLESQLDFDIASADNLCRFDTIIFPDSVEIDKKLLSQLRIFIKNGGKALLTGVSGIENGKFLLDVGAQYLSDSSFDVDYVMACDEISNNIVKSPFLFYEAAQRIKLTDGKVLARIKEPYFNRTYGHYCSHQNTPNQLNYSENPAVVQKGNIIYMGHSICRMYKKYGCKYHRTFFINTLKRLYKESKFEVNIQSGGRVRLTKQRYMNRYCLHVLYAVPIQRGITSVIEDIPDLYNIEVKVNVEEKIIRAYQFNKKIELRLSEEGNCISFTIPHFKCHDIIVLEY